VATAAAAEAHALTQAPLAQYPFALQRSDTFASAVLAVVHNLSSSPLLQCTYRGPLGAEHVRRAAPADVVGNPAAWAALAHSLAERAGTPDHLMLLHPVASPDEFCGACQAPASRASSASCRAAPPQRSSLEGRVGDECCDEGAGSHPAEEAGAQRVLHTPDHLLNSDELLRRGYIVRYYGLVAQSVDAGSSDGCYLVKTVQQLSARGGCNCTHYSLMRACAGVSLHQQAMDFWL